MEDDDSMYFWLGGNSAEYLYKGNRSGQDKWCATILWYNNSFCVSGTEWENFPAGATRDEVKAYVLTLWRMNGG